jgi:hypothetical protein
VKKKLALSGSALAVAAMLSLGGSIPAATAASYGEVGTTFCSGSSPVPWLKVRAIGPFLATPPGRGYSTYAAHSNYANWYGQGTQPGGGWSAWSQGTPEMVLDIDTSQTYGYCTPH